MIIGKRERDKTPCGNCNERKLGCHSNCDRYKNYVECRKNLKDKIHAYNSVVACIKESIKRSKSK